jgi:hypothetical protein
MSISWNLNKFAKNALLNAQKRIDSVLDIKETEEEKEVEDEEEQPVSEIDSTNFSALSDDATEVESNTEKESVNFDGIDEVCEDFSFAD